MAATSLPHDVLPDSDERHELTHHRAAAHLDLMLEVAACSKKRRKGRPRVGWDATDGRNGGAERTAWETPLEIERFDHFYVYKFQYIK